VLKHPRRKLHKKKAFLGLLRWGGYVKSKKKNQKLIDKSGLDFDVDPPLPSEQAEDRVKNREISARMSEQICFLICEFRSSPVFRE